MIARRRERAHGKAVAGLFRSALFLLAGGLLLFFSVWWPIQAERRLIILKRTETQLLLKKTELNVLNARYASLTSLAELDAWSKRHGPWRSPGPEDILAIQ